MAQQYEYRAMWKAKLQRTRLAETNFLKEYISTFFSIPADPSGVPRSQRQLILMLFEGKADYRFIVIALDTCETNQTAILIGTAHGVLNVA